MSGIYNKRAYYSSHPFGRKKIIATAVMHRAQRYAKRASGTKGGSLPAAKGSLLHDNATSMRNDSTEDR